MARRRPAKTAMSSASPKRFDARCGTSSRSIAKVLVFGEDVGRKGGVHLVTEGLQKQFGDRARVRHEPVGRRNHRARRRHGDRGSDAGRGDSIPEVRRPCRRAAQQLRHAAMAHGEPVRGADRRAHAGRIRKGRRRSVAQPERRSSLRARRTAGRWRFRRTPPTRSGCSAAAMRGANPTIFFEHRSLLMTSDGSARYPGDDYVLPFGSAQLVARRARDITVVSGARWCTAASRPPSGSAIASS